jgi:hypothetical protein
MLPTLDTRPFLLGFVKDGNSLSSRKRQLIYGRIMSLLKYYSMGPGSIWTELYVTPNIMAGVDSKSIQPHVLSVWPCHHKDCESRVQATELCIATITSFWVYTMNQIITTSLPLSLLITANLCMSKILHANPRRDNPDPGHDTRQDHQAGVVPRDGQRRVVLELWRRVGSRAHVPGPAPYPKAAPHANHKHDPGDYQNDPTPPFRLGIVKLFWGRRERRCCEPRERQW